QSLFMFKYLRQLASESLVYGLTGVLARFISVFLIPVYTRVFSPDDYGVMSLVTTTMAFVSTFVVLALDNSAQRWFWDTEAADDRKETIASWVCCQLVVSFSFATVIILSADHLAQWILGRPGAGIYFCLVAISIPLSALGNVLTNWLRMQRRPWAATAYFL